MSRKLKFRIWDKKANQFISFRDEDNRSVAPLMDIKGQLYNWPSQRWGIDNELYNNQEDYIIQQFTGYKDKQNREIYEGDIVKTIYELDKTGIVVFDTQLASFRTSSLTRVLNMPFITYRVKENMPEKGQLLSIVEEVIGNIYENPELLNKEKIC